MKTVYYVIGGILLLLAWLILVRPLTASHWYKDGLIYEWLHRKDQKGVLTGTDAQNSALKQTTPTVVSTVDGPIPK